LEILSGTWFLVSVGEHQQAELAQLVARPTEDRKVTRSIRVHGIIYFLLSTTTYMQGGVAKWSTAVDSNDLQYQLLFEGAGSNPVSVAFCFCFHALISSPTDGLTKALMVKW
jgi:hypothetical protein